MFILLVRHFIRFFNILTVRQRWIVGCMTFFFCFGFCHLVLAMDLWSEVFLSEAAFWGMLLLFPVALVPLCWGLVDHYIQLVHPMFRRQFSYYAAQYCYHLVAGSPVLVYCILGLNASYLDHNPKELKLPVIAVVQSAKDGNCTSVSVEVNYEGTGKFFFYNCQDYVGDARYVEVVLERGYLGWPVIKSRRLWYDHPAAMMGQ